MIPSKGLTSLHLERSATANLKLPPNCACCLAPPTAQIPVTAQTSEGLGLTGVVGLVSAAAGSPILYGKIRTNTWLFPVCRSCKWHSVVHQLSFIPAFVVVIPASLLILAALTRGMNTGSGGFGLAIFGCLLLGGLVGVLVHFSIVSFLGGGGPNCRTQKPPVTCESGGLGYAFSFANPIYAERFGKQNGLDTK